MNFPRAAIPLALLATAVVAVPAQAKSAKVKKASLSWAQTNVYNTAVPSPAQRTFAGYTAFLSKGSVTPLAGAKGQTIDGTSAAGVTSAYTQTFTGTKGKVDAKKVKGTVTLKGVVEFKTTSFTTTVENPKLVLNGKTAQIIASGKTSSAAAPTYSDKPLLDLNLATAKISKKKKKLTIKGAVPSIATADLAFPATYPVGAGPERMPNTFGSFDVTVSTR